ncbi:hypothetical protein [Promicromonospora sukumoe]|uniref:restriction endonuclease n=1 Tax=Promicromonospora sukumoe TaxID=88382 RepID=UPI003667EEF4
MTALEDLLDDYVFRPEPERDTKFEELMKAFLRADEEWAATFDTVWSWGEWPEREGPGNGIDLVAREQGTERLAAVHCAFHDPAESLTEADVSAFLSASDKAPFTTRLVVATTDKWDKDLEDLVRAEKVPVGRIGLTRMLDSSVDWSPFGPRTVATTGRASRTALH